MKDPLRPPGFAFVRLRVLNAGYELGEDRPEGTLGEIALGYKDDVKVEGHRVVVKQTVEIKVLESTDKSTVLLRAMVELEGTFEGSADSNLSGEDFGHNNVPAILFAFSREWIHKLTSAAGDWPPILLEPVNVLALRARAAAAQPTTPPSP